MHQQTATDDTLNSTAAKFMQLPRPAVISPYNGAASIALTRSGILRLQLETHSLTVPDGTVYL